MPAFAPQQRTTDATPLLVYTSISIPSDSVSRVPVYVFAFDHSLGVAYWAGVFAVRRLSDGTVSFVGSFTKTASPAAAGWNVVLSVLNGELYVTITGAAGVTVDWLITNDDSFSMVGVYQGS